MLFDYDAIRFIGNIALHGLTLDEKINQSLAIAIILYQNHNIFSVILPIFLWINFFFQLWKMLHIAHMYVSFHLILFPRIVNTTHNKDEYRISEREHLKMFIILLFYFIGMNTKYFFCNSCRPNNQRYY